LALAALAALAVLLVAFAGLDKVAGLESLVGLGMVAGLEGLVGQGMVAGHVNFVITSRKSFYQLFLFVSAYFCNSHYFVYRTSVLSYSLTK
jgi:hypothetical protein